MGIAITVVVAVIGIGVTLYFGKKCREPMYAISGTNLASSSISQYGDLGIRFAGKPVQQVTVTHICFWNAGRETIRKEDIAEKGPIKITAPAYQRGVRILSCDVVDWSRAVINACVKKHVISHTVPDDPFAEEPAQKPMEVIHFEVLFDFLDKDDYILFQVLHTGKSPEDCCLSGTVKGCKQGIRRVSREAEMKGLLAAGRGILGLLIYMFFVFFGAMPSLKVWLQTQAVWVNYFAKAGLVAFGAAFVVWALLGIRQWLLYRILRTVLPR